MIEMNRSEFPYRNSNIKYVKELFSSTPKAKGKLVAISNGGYSVGNGTQMRPHFGFRIYWDGKIGQYNCQVISQTREVLHNEYLKEYSVAQIDAVCVESIQTAILYNEYRIRMANS